ncbi:hemin-degrading factor [Pantoea agglomerans]|uniref:hemin-degrading factor n=1 Tax=Pantoea TaxID=53335 RepID=UPI00068F9D26|nr:MULTISPECIES: hemin-degrading factor [Pantoea]KOA71293.1 hemin transporter [Pantoea sp. CFSAN033090]NYB31483.1 hemin-degrading factor [Pantoea agglomerans]
MTERYEHYFALQCEHQKKYARDLAALMGIGEAQLCEARIGRDAKALKTDFPALLAALEAVGETKNITRNEYAVHELVGKYENQHLGEHAGLILNPRALDQRLFPQQWHSAFFLQEMTARGEHQSIQIFDRHGDAVLKIYTTHNTDVAAWDALITQFTTAAHVALELIPARSPQHSTTVDASTIEAEWRAMTDVHQFFGLLKRHNISRQQAFHAVADDLAWQVSNDSLAQLLNQAQQDGNEIMIFVGNRGCTQIFTGTVEKLMSKDNWVNIFTPSFTLHLMADQISESWVTRKQGCDGFVTSFELFASDGTQIAQLYGQRSEGTPEQARWCEQLALLTTSGAVA